MNRNKSNILSMNRGEFMEILRPCVFKTEDDTEHTGYFHTWEQISVGKTAFMRGIVEKENGEVVKVAPTLITFTDRKW